MNMCFGPDTCPRNLITYRLQLVIMPESSALPAAEAGDATRSADQDAEETHGFTEAQIAEYKEQDRYLPVSSTG